MRCSVIITTYNAPQWLEKVFWGYLYQDEPDFELVIADDGSGPETKALIDRYKNRFKHPIRHIWHEDVGFRKTRILNHAIVASQSDYLIFTDGDCIPRDDFVSQHLALAKPGYYLSAATFRLPLTLSQAISKEDVAKGRVFDTKWLRKNKLNRPFKMWRVGLRSAWFGALIDTIIPTKPTWNGANSSGWKQDLIAANGFDHTMAYGGLDVEMGYRLLNHHIKPRRVRNRIICVHLDHARGYVSEESWAYNQSRIKRTREENVLTADEGINEL